MKIAIIGAGPTGLVAAHELLKTGASVTVFEGEGAVGGLVRMIPSEGEPLEAFYHHIFTSDGAVPELAEEMGLQDRLRWYKPSNALFVRGKLRPFTTPGDLLRLDALSLMDRVRFGLFVLRAQRRRHWGELEGITARQWVEKEAGRAVYEVLWHPLLRSKFGEHADDIGATWLWNKIKLRSSSRGAQQRQEMLGYLDGGFGLLYETLAEDLRRRGAQIRLSCPVERVDRAFEGGLRVTTPEGEERFDRLLATCSPAALAELAPGLPEDFLLLDQCGRGAMPLRGGGGAHEPASLLPLRRKARDLPVSLHRSRRSSLPGLLFRGGGGLFGRAGRSFPRLVPGLRAPEPPLPGPGCPARGGTGL
jgi:protoporphyrinogen oxidase